MVEMTDRLVAVWPSEYSYLGGEITKMYDDGKVETKNFGPGFRFTPVKILPYAAGMVFLTKAKQLDGERVNKLVKVNQEYAKKIKELLNGN